MSKTIVNLTTAMVEAEAETVLKSYPRRYQQSFSSTLLRQKLVAFVLSRIPGMYAVVEECESESCSAYCPPEQRQHIVELIQRGIEQLFTEDSPSVPSAPSEVKDREVDAPSHWFG